MNYRDKKGRFVKGFVRGELKERVWIEHLKNIGFKRKNIPLNKGLTKETDYRIKRRAEKNSQTQKGIRYSPKTEFKKGFDKRRKISRGKEHPFWNGGSSFEPYTPEFNNKLKKKIKERDKNKCLCEGTHKGILSIHHINYDKKDCRPKNLITVCASHNSLANRFREYWMKYYQLILSKRHGYNYI